MSHAPRKGWCPGALRPMAAKDGLLVRLRITGGILSSATAHAVADLAARHGNGLLDLSARGNLQMRGVRDAALPQLQDGLQALGLIDADAGGEAVRNVIASPFAGLHGGRDIRRLVAALERRLVEDRTLHALPGKFGFLIDDASRPSLAGIAADVRFDWVGTHFSIGLGGTRSDAVRLAACEADDVVARAAAAAGAFLTLTEHRPDARRMRDLVAMLGREPIMDACGGRGGDPPSAVFSTAARDIVGLHHTYDSGEDDASWCAPSSTAKRGRGTTRRVVEGAAACRRRPREDLEAPIHPPDRAPAAPSTTLRVVPLPRLRQGRMFAPRGVDPFVRDGDDRRRHAGSCLGLAVPFGRLDAAMLQSVACIAGETRLGELRLTPWRVILVPGAERLPESAGFIIDPSDPRLAVAACPGADGCARGTTDTHADATALAASLRPGTETALHVSGCAKGCAKPSASPLTLVARDGRYDLVRDGRPGDAPYRHGLDLETARDVLQAALEPA